MVPVNLRNSLGRKPSRFVSSLEHLRWSSQTTPEARGPSILRARAGPREETLFFPPSKSGRAVGSMCGPTGGPRLGLPAARPPEKPPERPDSCPWGWGGRRASSVACLALGSAGARRGGLARTRLRGRCYPDPQETPPLERALLPLQGLCQDVGWVAALADFLGLDLALSPGLLHEGQLSRKALHLRGHLVCGGPMKYCEGIQVKRGGFPGALPQLSRHDAMGF